MRPLCISSTLTAERTGDMNAALNLGTHVMQLYEPPVPEADVIPLEEHWQPKEWHRYGKATLRIHVFQGTARPGSLVPSEVSEDEEEKLPQVHNNANVTTCIMLINTVMKCSSCC